MGRVFGYVRVSTVEQTEGTSLSEQRRRIEGLSTAIGKPVAHVYEDAGVSGSVPLRDRPAGAELVATLQPGDTLLACKLDRLFRSASDALATAEQLKARGVDLILLDLGTEPVTGTGVARLFFGMLALVAEFERHSIAERRSMGQKAKRASGGHIGGEAPFGYRVQGTGKAAVLVPVPDQLQALEQMRELKAAGMSLRAISAAMAQRGVAISHVGVGRALAR